MVKKNFVFIIPIALIFFSFAIISESYSVHRFRTKIRDYDIVNFSLYYETLCPGCRGYIKDELWKAFNQVSSIMNLTIVPYGNANETYQEDTKTWLFQCQHGPDECWGNLLHSCLLYYLPDTNDHFPYIHCMESDDQDDIRLASIKCAKQFMVPYNQVLTCMNSTLGNQLQHANAVKTETLQPPKKHVPHIVLNGQHTDQIENDALNDTVGLICRTYRGSNIPAACKKYKN